MKKLMFIMLLLFCAAQSNAQVRLEDIVKPGTRLIYGVESDGNKYDFIVTVKDKKGTSFEWEMTSPANMKGKIIHTPLAMQNGYKMWNYFQSETKKLDDQTLSVWISQKIFRALNDPSGDPVKIGMYGLQDEPLDMANVKEMSSKIRVDGKDVTIGYRLVMPVKLENNTWVIDKNNDDYLMFNNSASFPIIINMHDRFMLVLKEVRSK
jgi:hypothetical protein